jgi:hypothetical protein
MALDPPDSAKAVKPRLELALSAAPSASMQIPM